MKRQPLQTADAARKLAELVDFAKSFASDSDINTVVGIVNQDLDLKDCLQRKEEEVAALQHRVDSDKARFNDTLQANLAAYVFSKDKLKGELEESRNEIRALKDKLGEDEHAIKTLKESEAKFQCETKRLLETSRIQKDKAKSDLTKISELEVSLDAAGKDKVTLQTQLQQEESSHTQARSAFNNLQQMFNKLEKEYNTLLQEWQLAQSLSVTLTNDDPEQLCLEFDTVWSKTVVLVNSMFSRDLAEEVLQNQTPWKALRQLPGTRTEISNPLPIVPSNSKSAKQMRIVSIIAILARQFDAYLLQPTYLLDSDNQLRDLLLDQALDEPRKESAVRGLVQALLPKRQDSTGSTRVAQVCDKIMHIIQDLLPKNLQLSFREQLEELAEEARDRWGDVLRSQTAIFPSFDLDDEQDWAWNELRLDSNQSTVAVKEPQSQDEEAEDDPLLVVFPRLCTYHDGNEHPMSHGVVLTLAQIAAAKEEEHSYSRARLTRQGMRTRRGTNGTEDKRRRDSMDFLGRRPTS
ncbi:hypothetical protein MBLNU13_g06796t2 [Cladosporium sp. NU13]